MKKSNNTALSISYLREHTMGHCYAFDTPFGQRLMTYADYIASGRNLRFVEQYLLHLQEAYANTHTEDDVTGKHTTELLHQAETRIKAAVNGNKSTCIISTGSGATGAIQMLQKIIGLYVPPATRAMFLELAKQYANAESSAIRNHLDTFEDFFNSSRPVVFIGPFEHHSNEVTWRESLAEVVKIDMTSDGLFDLDDLEKKLADSRYEGRRKIGSFSAASNVTGVISPVYDIARLMHRHGGIACFDYAASAPYVEIDMNRDEESYLDAIFVSPHKFLGGPGSTGLLIFNEKLYDSSLPPTCGGGGTVDYVGPTQHDFIKDIEEREKAGTPGTLQMIRAALALETKSAVGAENIEKIERRFISEALDRFGADDKIHILGNTDPDKRISILSFNIRHGERILHPKFVTRLLNDLFGIQSRAGCSCAGPYGHRLLNIGLELSEKYRCQIVRGYNSIKPGWVRVGFHFTFDDIDFNFICDAIEFVAEYGYRFLPMYSLDLHSGTWTHVEDSDEAPHFSLAEAMSISTKPLHEKRGCDRKQEYAQYLEAAHRFAEKLGSDKPQYLTLPDTELEALRFFEVVNLTGI